jgi:PAS domain S-box-containing protein
MTDRERPPLGKSRPFDDRQSMEQAVEAGDIGLWQWQIAAGVTHLSEGRRALLGPTGSELQVSNARLFDMIHPDDLPGLRRSVREAISGGGRIDEEFRLVGSDGSVRWIGVTGKVIERSADGVAMTAAGIFADVTKRHEAQDAAAMLNRELRHRMKNLLSVVGNIATVSAENNPEASEFQSRLNRLAAAHELLTDAARLHIPLGALAEKALSPLGVLDRVRITANDLLLDAHDAQTLVLVLHELATNAIKYGALSTSLGHVRLSFTIDRDAKGATPMKSRTVMMWEESGGPRVRAPRSKGFGVGLIERLGHHQGAETPVLQWRQDGLVCRIPFRAAAA